MHKRNKQFLVLGFFTLLLALLVAVSMLVPQSAYASTYTPWQGHTTSQADVRSGPSTSDDLITTYPPNTNVTVYAAVTGEVIGDTSTWYRISSLNKRAGYINGGFITSGTWSGSNLGGPAPLPVGKVIVVSLSYQWLYAYEDGTEVFNHAVITGRSALPTPTGTYHIIKKFSPKTFYSPWPPGSPYWYAPTQVNYALEFRADGYYLHDSGWHSVYGPGDNNFHFDPRNGWQWGSHGCINMPIPVANRLYDWAPIGTTVIIRQ
jgi:L,D-transpeptidase catalytic domain/Bacterial SH3 domain